jgi:hypothetical protein
MSCDKGQIYSLDSGLTNAFFDEETPGEKDYLLGVNYRTGQRWCVTAEEDKKSVCTMLGGIKQDRTKCSGAAGSRTNCYAL